MGGFPCLAVQSFFHNEAEQKRVSFQHCSLSPSTKLWFPLEWNRLRSEKLTWLSCVCFLFSLSLPGARLSGCSLRSLIRAYSTNT